MNSKIINGIRSVIAAILHQFTLYPLFMMSNIMPFMISYLYQIEKESSKDKTSSLTQDDGYFIHPIMSLSMSICCFFGGIVEHYLGPKLAILIGGISIALGDFLFTVSKSLILHDKLKKYTNYRFLYCFELKYECNYSCSETHKKTAKTAVERNNDWSSGRPCIWPFVEVGEGTL